MKTINHRKIICFFAIFSVFSTAIAQQVFYRASPNIIFANDNTGALQFELNYQFNIMQAQLLYNVHNNYFLFGTYNIDHSTFSYDSEFFYDDPFGDELMREKNNLGFSIGVGSHKLGKIGSYENLELLAGFENQKVNTVEYFNEGKPEYRDDLQQDYYKIFTQFNMIKNRDRFDLGYSIKLSYFKITKFEYNLNSYNTGKSLFLLDPSITFNYKLLPKRNLIMTSQIGLSAALGDFKYEYRNGVYTDEISEYLITRSFKIGLIYRFIQ